MNNKINELVKEFESAKLDVIIITETKQKGKNLTKINNNHILINSGIEQINERAKAGVACIINKKYEDYLDEWNAVNERILTITLKFVNEKKVITIIGVYGPNEDDTKLNKDKFWEQLVEETEKAKGDVYIIGDFNSRVGNNINNYETIIGRFGEDFRNGNGERMLNFCRICDLIICNTFFEHKNIHKFTREQPSRGEKSIIDYIVVPRSQRSKLKDVRVRRSHEIGSDHYLLIAEIYEKMKINENKEIGEKKIYTEIIKSYKLKSKDIYKKYQNEIRESIKYKIVNNTLSLDEDWNQWKEMIINAARKVCGTNKQNKQKKQTSWWNNQIKEQIKIKKKKWQIYLNNRSYESYEDYKKERIKTKKIVLKSKEIAWTEFGKRIEINAKENQKVFYKIIKNVRNNKKEEYAKLKDEKGQLLTTKEDIMERWRIYFENLLNENVIIDEDTEINYEESEQDEIEEKELDEAIKSLKNGKAPGIDKITTEMIKYLDRDGKENLRKLINRVWKEERVPKEWEIAMIVPIYKAGDKRECKNYRGISLIGTVCKLYEKIIEKRIRRQTEMKMSEEQSGFRERRCVQDHIFTLKTIINRTLEAGKEIYIGFIDMEKAFDKVPRKRIWDSLERMGVNYSLIKACKTIYKTTRNIIISKNMISKEFITKQGVRQGGSLSPLLFVIFLEMILEETNKLTSQVVLGRRNRKQISVRCCMFADDVAILTETKEELQKNLTIWNEVLEKFNMKMNKSKTKVMAISAQEKKLEIQIENEKIEQVKAYKYLGVILDEHGNQEQDINRRIESTNKLFYTLKNKIIRQREINRNTKLKIYKTIYRPILTFGCESWILTEKIKSKIRAIEMKFLRGIYGVSIMDKIRSDKIREELEIQSVEQHIKERQLGWWGHLVRTKIEMQTKNIWKTKIVGVKKRGRPKKTWDEEIEEIFKDRGITRREGEQLAKNKNRFKKFIKCN